MQSMTGYGKAEYKENGVTITVEIKTVNNRFLDFIPKYPRSFAALDDTMRKIVQSRIKRGRTELFVSYSDERGAGKEITVDKNVAAGYVAAGKTLSEEFGVENDVTAVSLMKCPDVLVEKVSDVDEETLRTALTAALDGALDALCEMRAKEGEKLKADVLYRCGKVEEYLGIIEKRAPALKEEYFVKLKTRIAEILGDVKYDEGRLLQETAVFVDKSDISEEITRLKSHISQLRNICDQEEDVGKKLDFLMQEFNRETNTICSKSNDSEITAVGLSMKNEIEKMREQVQNIE